VKAAPPPKAPAPVETPAERHRRILREQADAKQARATTDVGWFKTKIHEAYSLVHQHRTLEALTLLDALGSLGRKLHPGENPDEAEAQLDARRAEHLAFLTSGETGASQ
jgi:hypothetical protein